jgi:hypothetical protein
VICLTDASRVDGDKLKKAHVIIKQFNSMQESFRKSEKLKSKYECLQHNLKEMEQKCFHKEKIIEKCNGKIVNLESDVS